MAQAAAQTTETCPASRCGRRRGRYGLCTKCWVRLPGVVQSRVLEAWRAAEARPNRANEMALEQARAAAVRMLE